jgi:hypothetical protein
MGEQGAEADQAREGNEELKETKGGAEEGDRHQKATGARKVAQVAARGRAVSITPSVSSIKEEVNQVLLSASPQPPDPLEPCMSLEFELKLADDISFQNIARKSRPGSRVSDDECGDLDVVEDAWVLVVEKSGLSLDKECQ